MESANYTTKQAVEAIQELDFREDICNINRYIKKKKECKTMTFLRYNKLGKTRYFTSC